MVNLSNLIPDSLKIRFFELSETEQRLLNINKELKEFIDMSYFQCLVAKEWEKFGDLKEDFKESLENYKGGRFYKHFSNKLSYLEFDEKLALGY